MKARTVYILVLILSFGVVCFASVFDPLALPFPDWNQMPEEMKAQYIQESKIYSTIRNIGIVVFLVSVVGIVFQSLRLGKK
ncbi:hypothetical protein P886_0778 [Alteromonadaceae bacterium 2753L.S.0a.02]|nr:hypothetical protein P886_0778 [Alteromonadaceae bacterium 2753L.S.0a.02]